MRSLRWRLAWIALATAFAVIALVPRNTTQRVLDQKTGRMKDTTVRRGPINLRLDLQGGIHLALEVDQSRGPVPDPAEAIRRAERGGRTRHGQAEAAGREAEAAARHGRPQRAGTAVLAALSRRAPGRIPRARGAGAGGREPARAPRGAAADAARHRAQVGHAGRLARRALVPDAVRGRGPAHHHGG